MYFWNVNKLTKELKKGDLSEKEKFKYLMGLTILVSPIFVMPGVENFYDFLAGIVEILGGIIGLYLFYKINGGKKGKDLLTRYTSISFVTIIRSFVFLLIPLLILLIILETSIYGMEIPEESWWDVVVFTFLYMAGCIYMQIKYLKKVLD